MANSIPVEDGTAETDQFRDAMNGLLVNRHPNGTPYRRPKRTPLSERFVPVVHRGTRAPRRAHQEADAAARGGSCGPTGASREARGL